MIFFSTILTIATLVSTLCYAQGEVILNKNPLRVISTTLEHPQLPVGANTGIQISVELAEKHHAYESQFRILSNVEWLQISVPTVDPVTEFFDPVSKKNKKGIGGGSSTLRSVIGIKESAPGGNHRVQLELVYQACTKKYCLLPKKVPLEVEFKVTGGSSTWTSQVNNINDVSSSSKIEELLSQSTWLTFLIVFIAGVLTSLTPCIFPMIPITMAVLGARSEERGKIAGLGLSLSYVMGIAITYSVLGLVAASTGALFGSFLGHPAVAVSLGLLFFVMALSMFGLFEVQIPLTLQNKLGLHKTKGGFLGAFFTGQVAGLLASPCVGPVLVALLAYVAKSQNLTLGFFLLFTFAFGMGQIFLVIGTFSQALNKLPKAGHWMVGVKIGMGVAMLALSFFYIQPILPDDFFGTSLIDKKASTPNIPWEKYSVEVFAKAKSKGQPVIIDFYADWCAACIEMEVKTFSHKKIQAIKDQFIWIKYDATDTSTKDFKFLQKKYEIPGLPWFVFYSSTGEHLKDLTLAGFENVDRFLQRLEKVKSHPKQSN